MDGTSTNVEIRDVPPWSVVGLPGFTLKVLERWQRNFGSLPAEFTLVACPQVEINAIGGLPSRVRELTDSRVRILHFTGCHKPYQVILLFGQEADARRAEIQSLLAWSEGYTVVMAAGTVRLNFIEAIEETAEGYRFEQTAEAKKKTLQYIDINQVQVLSRK